jgi:dihydroflavonol-4-reductase
VASPFPPSQPKDADELIVPAREGTLRVLKAAFEAGAERVVVTSSVAAVGGRSDPSAEPLDESAWTDPEYEKLSPYARSKTIAERAAWNYARERDALERLAVVNPGAILGPVFDDDLSFSLELIKRLLGGTPGIPRIGFSVVDVRDVADLQIRAMTAPEAAGKRVIAVSEVLWM